MRCRLEQRAREESSNTVEMWARAGVSGFKKYLEKVDKVVTSIKHITKGGPGDVSEGFVECPYSQHHSAQCSHTHPYLLLCL